MNWYRRVTSDLSELANFIAYYDKQLKEAQDEVKVKGNIERNLSDLPGITEHRYNQLQEVEAVLEYMNIELRKLKRKHFKIYLESYNRALSSRDAEKYADGEDEVVDYEILLNEVAMVRNRYLGIMKAIESKNFMLGHITRLRTAGMEDATI